MSRFSSIVRFVGLLLCLRIPHFTASAECPNPALIGQSCDAVFTLEPTTPLVVVPEVGVVVVMRANLNSTTDTTSQVTVNSTAGELTDSSNVYSFQIDVVNVSHIGVYGFTARTEYNGTNHTTTTSFEIPYVLSVTMEPLNATHYFEKGTTASISATVNSDSGDFDKINVTVKKLPDGNEKTLEETPTGMENSRLYEFTFRGEPIAGNYAFTATETYNEFNRTASKTTEVIVEVPASTPVIMPSGPVTVTRGTEETVNCSSFGIPPPTITWSYGGVEVSKVTTSTVHQLGNGMLKFTAETPFDENGTYLCTATNTLMGSGKETITSSVSVTINGPPELQSSAKPTLQKEMLQISCTFDSFPLSDVTWFLDNDELNHSAGIYDKQDSFDLFYRTTSTLTINSALCLGAAEIECRAVNGMTADPSTVTRDIFYINSEKYNIYRNVYIIFSNDTSAANDIDCAQYGGSPASVTGDSYRTAITGFADSFSITDFYIEPSSATQCTYLEKGTSSWEEKGDDCTSERVYACDVTATKFPSGLVVEPDNCNAAAASVRWGNDNTFSQMAELTSATGSQRVSTLPSNVGNKTYSDLLPTTTYTFRVSTGYDICRLHAYSEEEFTTVYDKLATPDITVTAGCDVSWTYPSERTDELDGFNLTVSVKEKSSSIDTETSEIIAFSATARTYSFPTQPNSEYEFKLIGLARCIGNSDQTAAQTCTTPIAPPANLVVPSTTTTSGTDTGSGFEVSLSAISSRSGPIQCLCIVARWTTGSAAFSQIDNIDDQFSNIKQDGDDVGEEDDYFAFCLPNEEQTVTVGTGNQATTCSSNARRKRSISSSNTISAKNRALEANTEYQYYLVVVANNGTHFLFSNSPWSEPIPVNPVSNPVPVAAIVVPIIIILLIILVLVLFCMHRRRKAARKQSTRHEPHRLGQTHDNPAFSRESIYQNTPQDRSIAVENLRSTYHTKHSDEDRLFREEYRALATDVSELSLHFSYSMALEVRDKNRFSNIHPANESRVVLRRQGTDIYSDYINASYMDGYRQPRKYIAAQGPMPTTLGDFWYMVWEQESTVIVMLTRVDEGGRKKCEKYWPDDHEQLTFENVMVKSLSTVVYGPIIKRTFEVSNPNQSEKRLVVEQFHLTGWPDHGVPVTTSDLFRLRRMVLESQDNSPSPIVVHCSAGVGRTGTFIALDVLSNQMERERKVDVYAVVLGMRKKRKEMVQTVEQYSLLHKLMLEKHLFGETDSKTSEFNTTVGHSPDYEVIDSIEEGFYNLTIVPPVTAVKYFPPHESLKVRDKDVVPYQHSKVAIRMRPSEERPPFINASFLQSYSTCDAFIACQGPVQSSLEDFWRVVLDNNVTVVVMLSKLEENGQEECSQYWPEDRQNPCTFGDIIVSLQVETKTNECTERWMQVSEKVLHLRRSLTVMQLQYEKWSKNSAPADASDVLDLISRTQASRKTTQGKTFPVLVHCSDGAGRTGTFCAIVNLIERLKNEDRIDVFRTVKDLRDMRPLMVRTLDQYRFCYKAVQEYLGSFDLYANFK